MNPKFHQELFDALRAGGIVTNDGPTGVLVEFPKKMRTQTKVAIVCGCFLIFVYLIGLVVIAGALIDYAMQKKEYRFIYR